MGSHLDMTALDVFIQKPVSPDMVQKLVGSTLQVIQCQDANDSKSIGGRGKSLPSLGSFIRNLVKYTNVYTGTLMATLVLLDRLKSKLPHNAQGLACTRHRIFLSCLILASKFHNDSSPKNMHWAKYTDGLFSLKDVNLMERQLLYLLNWNVKVSNEEMIHHLHRFLAPIKEELVRTAKLKKFLQSQQQAALSRTHLHKNCQACHSSPGRSTISRSSSAISLVSLGRGMPVSPANSAISAYHTRQSSCSSVESVSPLFVQKSHSKNVAMHPYLEMTTGAQNHDFALKPYQSGHRSQPHLNYIL